MCVACCKACVLLFSLLRGMVHGCSEVHATQKRTRGSKVYTWVQCGHVAQKVWTRGSKAASRVALEVEGGMFLLSRPWAGSKQEERQAERMPNLLVCRANTTLH
jgi:hypothetical protein